MPLSTQHTRSRPSKRTPEPATSRCRWSSLRFPSGTARSAARRTSAAARAERRGGAAKGMAARRAASRAIPRARDGAASATYPRSAPLRCPFGRRGRPPPRGARRRSRPPTSRRTTRPGAGRGRLVLDPRQDAAHPGLAEDPAGGEHEDVGERGGGAGGASRRPSCRTLPFAHARRRGLFGPGSVTWRVHAHPAMLIGGLRALILQSLHPHALAGVTQHSDFRERPMHRLRQTATYVATTTFGTTRRPAPRATASAACTGTSTASTRSPARATARRTSTRCCGSTASRSTPSSPRCARTACG